MADRIIKPDSGDQLILQDDGGGDALTIETDQDVKINAGDLYFGTAGKGIVLGATSNVDANTLDDYETGTHAPTITGTGGGTLSATAGVTTFGYVKIGTQCHIQGQIGLSSISGASGRLKMTVPFTAGPDTSGSGSTWTDVTTWDVNYAGEGVKLFMDQDTAFFTLKSQNDAGSPTDLLATGYYGFSFTYRTV